MYQWTTAFRRLGLGRLALALWYRPIGRVRDSWHNGGPWAERATERHRREMEAAALQFGPLPTFPGPALTVHLMTGRRFWYQTLFCLHSLAVASEATVLAELYDDGTIDAECAAKLNSLGPTVRIHAFADLRDRVERLLPAERFPSLAERWVQYPNIRKLIDVHLGCSGWKLVIDSDLLFFRKPDALLRWAWNPGQPLVAEDCQESYGYSRPLMEAVVGAAIPPLVNVGLCGLRSEAIDWERLERWTTELQRRERTSYYLEQALVAMLIAGQPFVMAPRVDYLTLPDRAEVLRPRAVMHHYVADSKRWYFRHGWRHVAPHPVGAEPSPVGEKPARPEIAG